MIGARRVSRSRECLERAEMHQREKPDKFKERASAEPRLISGPGVGKKQGSPECLLLSFIDQPMSSWVRSFS